MQNADEKDAEGSMLDLNGKVWASCSSQELENANLRGKTSQVEGLLAMGKLKVRHTGFKPYKRCSVEAKESRMVNGSCQGEEKCSKRIRLEGEASI